jgi:TorA maturation chaperone TorD
MDSGEQGNDGTEGTGPATVPGGGDPGADERLAVRAAVGAALLVYPTPSAWPQLRAATALAREAEGGSRLEPTAVALEQGRAELEADAEAAMEEYTRLFVAAVPAPACRPLEAVYREQALSGASTLQVAALYARLGLQPQGYEPDHLLVELLFLHTLARQAPQLPDRAQLLVEFLQEHLRPWVPRWCGDLRAAARLPYYRHVADWVEATVAEEGPFGDRRGVGFRQPHASGQAEAGSPRAQERDAQAP